LKNFYRDHDYDQKSDPDQSNFDKKIYRTLIFSDFVCTQVLLPMEVMKNL